MTAASRTITLRSGITLSYAARGDESGPAVVLLPGPTDSWRSYEPVLEQLPHSIRVIAVSQRGHGDSDKPATGYRVEDFAADVVPLLDSFDIARAAVAGHSGSCLVARAMQEMLVRRISGAELLVYHGVGHTPPVGGPRAIHLRRRQVRRAITATVTGARKSVAGTQWRT